MTAVKPGHAVHAEVRHRERAAAELGRADLAVAHLAREVARLPRDVAQRAPVGVEHRRHDQRVLPGDGDAHVHAAVELELAVPVGAVGPRELAQGQRAGLHDHVVVGRHRRVGAEALLDLPAERDAALHVDVHADDEVGDRRLGLRHAAGDDALQPGRLLDDDVALGGAALGDGARGLGLRRLLLLGGLALVGCARRRTLDVRLHDPPARAGAVQRAEVDAALAGEAPGDRGRDHALAAVVGGLGLRGGLLVVGGLLVLVGLLGSSAPPPRSSGSSSSSDSSSSSAPPRPPTPRRPRPPRAPRPRRHPRPRRPTSSPPSRPRP